MGFSCFICKKDIKTRNELSIERPFFSIEPIKIYHKKCFNPSENFFFYTFNETNLEQQVKFLKFNTVFMLSILVLGTLSLVIITIKKQELFYFTTFLILIFLMLVVAYYNNLTRIRAINKMPE